MSLTVRTVHEPDELREFATVHATAFGYRWEEEKLEKLKDRLNRLMEHAEKDDTSKPADKK